MAGRTVDLIAMDPGATTGFATLDGDEIRAYQMDLTKYPKPHEVLYDHLCEVKPCSVAYEKFHHRQGQLGVNFAGVEYIGVIQLWAQQNKIVCYPITPSQGKAFWTDEKLKALELYQRGTPHGMDALRILMTYLMKNSPEWADSIIERLRSTLKSV